MRRDVLSIRLRRRKDVDMQSRTQVRAGPLVMHFYRFRRSRSLVLPKRARVLQRQVLPEGRDVLLQRRRRPGLLAERAVQSATDAGPAEVSSQRANVL